MQSDSSAEVPTHAVSALVAHLRQKPEDALGSPSELAARFGLSTGFVQSVLDGVKLPQRDDPVERRRLTFDAPRKVVSRLLAAFDRVTARPSSFIAVTTVLCIAFLVGLSYIRSGTSIHDRGFTIELNQGWAGAAMVFGVFILHMVTYYRRKMARHALYGGLVVWVCTAPALMTSVWLDTSRKGDTDRFLITLVVAFVMFVASSLYAGFGTLASVLGGWIRLKQEDLAEERMSRQQLLERYFSLQARLEQGIHSPYQPSAWLESQPVEWFQKAPLVTCLLAGLGLEFFQIAILKWTHLDITRPVTSPIGLFVIIVTSLVGLLILLSHVAAGFLSKTPARAVAASIFLSVGTMLPMIFPAMRIAVMNLTAEAFFARMGISAIIYALITLAAAMGANVQRRAARTASLMRNDQATVVAEMLRIQWRLSDHSSLVCVMVVDAVRSSEMKASADPLSVEYSFREYQEWLETISADLGGRVHSTAGDGAVIAFPNCLDAFLAAKRIQTDLGRFNSEINRLKSPFRLRIGLHVGQVVGDLDEVEFTEVIDIAAHVQGVAPIAGIAVSDSVVDQLAQEEFVPLAKEVDGHKVHLALDPTEG